MSEADIQALVDGIAAELGAAVWLGDEEDRLVAHTAHDEVIDEVRRLAIMNRRLTPEVRSWFEQWGILDATEPVRTPADKALGILERWCLPVRFRGVHLGYIWVLDAGRTSENDLAPALDAAEHIAALLYRRRLSTQANNDLLRLLLIPNPENETLAAEARATGVYMQGGVIAVIVAGVPIDIEPSPATLSDLALAVQRAAELTPSETVLAGVISGFGVLLAPLRNRNDLSPAYKLAERLRRMAVHVNHELDLIAAIGSSTELEQASHSYAEARRALRMARAMPDLGPIVRWDELGIFRALALLPADEIENGALDPRVRQLLTDQGLAATAEVFLDLAGDVQQTAARLFVHRTTLYQRLDRIAALYGLDLRRNGDHRLLVHLGIKLAQVTGFPAQRKDRPLHLPTPTNGRIDKSM